MAYVSPDSAGRTLTYEQAAEALDVTVRTVRGYVRREALPWTHTGQTLANGHRQKGIPAPDVFAHARASSSTAPDDPPAPAPATQSPDAASVGPAQLQSGRGGPPALRQTALLDNCPERPDHVPDHIPLTADGLPDVAAMEAMGLQDQADEWGLRLMAVREFNGARDAAEHGETRAAADAVAERWGQDTSTLYRWAKRVREGGPTALMPGYGHQRGETCLPQALQHRILDFYLDQRRPTIAQTYRHVVLPWYASDGRKAPHVSTVRRWLRDTVTPLQEQAYRHGRRAYDAHMRPKVVRETPEPNEVWCADHRLWDVHVLCPDGKGTGWGGYGARPCPCGSGKIRRDCCSLRRPWITAIVDVGSAAWVGWRIGLTPTASGVCHALRDALMSFGIPQTFVRDNGKEFLATVLGGKPERLRDPSADGVGDRRRWPAAMPHQIETSGIWVALGVQVITSRPYSAWSKPIESLFHSFSRIEDENLMVGWAGRDAAGRPEVLEKHVEKGLVLTWQEFAETFARQVHDWNTSHTCGDRAAPPVQLYAGHTLRIPDGSTLAFLLRRERENAYVRANGVLAGGRRYFSPALAPYVSQRLPLVRWDDEAPDEIVAYTPDDKVLAVPLAQKATWNGWGEANEIAARGAREQRALLARTAAQIKGACPVEQADPTGTYGLVARRVAARHDEGLQQAADRERQALEEGPSEQPRPRTIYQDAVRRRRRDHG